jgi:hypothetical protein
MYITCTDLFVHKPGVGIEGKWPELFHNSQMNPRDTHLQYISISLTC